MNSNYLTRQNTLKGVWLAIMCPWCDVYYNGVSLRLIVLDPLRWWHVSTFEYVSSFVWVQYTKCTRPKPSLLQWYDIKIFGLFYFIFSNITIV